MEKSATSIEPTINAVNSLLKSFGFHTFTLSQAESTQYKLVRANGENAQETLSESEKFEGKERLICKSLFSLVNDGSHYAMDELFVSLEPGAIDAYMAVFEQVFEKMGHGPHYKMMMGRA